MSAVVTETGRVESADGGKEARIVDAVVAREWLKGADLGRARRLQEEAGGQLLALLARLALVSEADPAETVAEVLDLPLVTTKELRELPPEGSPLTVKFMKQFHVCPVAKTDATVDVLVADPQDA